MEKKETTIQSVMEAVMELRTAAESNTAESKQKVEKIQAFLNEQETKNQKLTQEQESTKRDLAEAKERMDTLEKSLAKANASSKESKEEEHAREIKALEQFMVKGKDSMSADEKKYLRTDKESDGGVLAPAEYVREIIKDITEISPMRSIARVRRASAGRLEIPVRESLVTAEWEGEGEEGTDSHSTYGMEKMPLNKLTVTVPITIEELMDSAFNMEAEINGDIVEAFNQKEGAAFVSGTAVKRPEGFAALASLQSGARVTGHATQITMDSILRLTGDLKTGYNPVYLMNRSTLAEIRVLKDGQGQYLWQAGNIAAGLPNTLGGYNYVEVPDMDNIGAGAYPIAFGDFRRGYLIADGMALSVIRDPYALKKEGKVEFTFTRRVGGGVVKTEAIKLLKVSAS